MDSPDLMSAIREAEERANEERAAEADQQEALRQQERPQSYTPKDARRLRDRLPKPEGFLEDDQMFRRANICAIVGPGGVFKTWFIQFMLARISLGKTVHKFKTRQGNSILFSEELDRASMIERLYAMFDDVEADEIDDRFRFRCNSNFDFYARTFESQKKLERIWKDEGRPDVVSLDALSQIHHGNENSNQDMGIVWGGIKEVAVEHNFNVNVIHHYGKPNEFRQGADKIRGAAVIQNICSDIMLVDPGKGHSVVTIAKHRDYRWGEPDPFSFKVERKSHGEGVVLTFAEVDKEDDKDEVNPKHVDALVKKVEELAGKDGEVLRDALQAASGFGVRRFKAALAAACDDSEGAPRLVRIMRGKEASYSTPRREVQRQDDPYTSPMES